MLSHSLGMPSRDDGPPSIWDQHGIIGETFLQIQRRPLQHLIRKSPILGSLMYQNTHHPHVVSDSQTPAQDQRCQPRPSARHSVVPGEGRCSKNCGTDQQRLQISDPHFDKLRQQRSLVGILDSRPRYVLAHNFPVEAMLWIKEVELVDSVGWSQIFVFYYRNLNTIHNTRFKKKVSLEELKGPKRGPFFSEESRSLT